MDNYKRISVRFNLARSDHKKAWDILSALPQGMMNEYITSTVLNTENERRLKKIVTECMQDILDQYSLKKEVEPQHTKKHSSKSHLDEDALYFIKNL